MSLFERLFPKKKETPAETPKDEPQTGDIEEELKKVLETLDKYKRKAYLPKVFNNEPTFSDKSKIGGFPYLRNEDDWPQCPNCTKHMQLFLQLNLKDLPEKKDDGLIQLFYCTTGEPLCEVDLEAFFPFSKAVNCRKITTEEESAQIIPVLDEIFDEKIIVDWTAIDDYPHFEEYEFLGIDVEMDDDIYALMDDRQVGMPVERDKLFGWPYWIQSVEYPFDRKTQSKMELLFQFDSEDNLPHMFGDAGIGHLTQSPDNKEELGFGWACG